MQRTGELKHKKLPSFRGTGLPHRYLEGAPLTVEWEAPKRLAEAGWPTSIGQVLHYELSTKNDLSLT
jgi:hypothetical protein